MFYKQSRIEKLHKQLIKSFKRKPGREARLLPDGQLLIRKGMISNPSLKFDGKWETFIPGPDGYEIYVAYQSQSTDAATVSTSQRGPRKFIPANTLE